MTLYWDTALGVPWYHCVRDTLVARETLGYCTRDNLVALC